MNITIRNVPKGKNVWNVTQKYLFSHLFIENRIDWKNVSGLKCRKDKIFKKEQWMVTIVYTCEIYLTGKLIK